MGECRVRLRAQVEREVGVDVAGVGVNRELFCGTAPFYVLRRHQLLANVRLIGNHLLDRDLEIGRESPNESPNPGPAEEEGRIGDELDGLRGLPPDEPVRTVA